MDLEKASNEELNDEYERLRLLIVERPFSDHTSGKTNWRKIVRQRESIVQEVRNRGLNPHDVLMKERYYEK